jgi:class 3 adenylate cyclase
MSAPPVRYALHDGQSIGYQVVGEGPLDLVYCGGLVSHLDLLWDIPEAERFMRRLAAFSRLILFDRRGAGISDPLPPAAEGSVDLDAWCADLRAVLDAVGSTETAIFAESEAGRVGLAYAARDPQRVSKLVLSNCGARYGKVRGYPCGEEPARAKALLKTISTLWGTEEMAALSVPSRAQDRNFLRLAARFQRASASPQRAQRQFQQFIATDVRDCLPSVRCPVLILRRRSYPFLDAAAHAAYLEQHLFNAHSVEIDGADALFSFDRADEALAHIEEFLIGSRAQVFAERVVKTVLFADIVGSTELARDKGDSAWRDLVVRFQQLVRAQLARFHGQEVDAAGDGFFSVFDSPTGALRAAVAMREEVHTLGVQLRCGLHAGECEVGGGQVRGLTVHIGARVMGEAKAGEIWVSRTLRDLVFGSGLEFERRGEHELKGVPGRWRLYALAGAEAAGTERKR